MYYVRIDPTPESLYTAIFELYRREPPELVTSADFQSQLGAEVIEIHSDPLKAARIAHAVRNFLGDRGEYALREVYAAETCDCENRIFRYLKHIFAHGGAEARNLAAKPVREFEFLRQRVSLECHRLKGFVRFQSTASGAYYAKIEPDYNVTALILPFFCQRFPDQDFMIHDIRRGIAGVSHGHKQTVLQLGELDFEVNLTENEMEFQRLFREYYRKVSVKELRNIRLMLNFMPRRYQKNLPETDERP